MNNYQPRATQLGKGSVPTYRRKLINAAMADGGCTLNCNALQAGVHDGYVVGGAGPVLVIELDGLDYTSVLRYESHAKVEQWLRDGIDDDNLPKYPFVGSWVDDNAIYFDWCDVVYDRSAALALSERRGELAFYDVAHERSVYLKEQVA